MNIRPEEPTDIDAIGKVVQSAFPKPDEANLVSQLRKDGDSIISLVAIVEDQIVGHVMFSRMTGPLKALGLGPVAVSPDYQRKGVGSALIKTGIEQATAQGWEGIFVLGDPAYYQRFGFNVAMASGFASPYAGPYFMVLSLARDLPQKSGAVAYAPAFAALE